MPQKQADKKPLGRIGNAVKKAASVLVPTLTCIAAALYIASVYMPDIAVQATVNGDIIGNIESNTTLMAAKADLESSVYTLTEGKYDTNYTIGYSFAASSSDDRLSSDDCSEILWSYISEDFTEAYMLYVDGHQAAANESENALADLITNIEDQILSTAGDSFRDVRISNNVRIEKQLCLESMLKSTEEINELLNPLAHQSQPEVIMTRISTLSAAVPTEADSTNTFDEDLVLDYNFLNTITVDEVIYYNTLYIDDETNFIGNEKIAQEGVNGARTVTYEIVYDADGNIISRNELSETVITEVVDKIVMVGTAPIPDAVPTGSLIWPCESPRGVSSYYGWRDLYGKPDFHLGIDIPNDKGSSIWAADGGEVIFAGYTPSYGYSVRVQHSDTTVTLYAHLDKILVKVGDMVYQGQQIGTMGRTGVAYGVHLHFEVRINNTTTNPLKHLPKQ